MLIGIDASRANRAHKSGTEWYSYYLIRHLAQLDKDNEYILYTDTPLMGGLADLANDFFEDSAPVYDEEGYQKITSPHNNFKAKVLNWPWKFFWTQGRLSLEMIWNSPDVLFIPAHALPIIHPKKSLVTIHDIGFKREGQLYERSSIGPEKHLRQRTIDLLVRLLTFNRYGANTFDYLDWSTRFSLRKARVIITISKFTKNELKECYGAKEEKIKVIYNGYNNDLYKKMTTNSADILKAKNIISSYGLREPYIFYVGRLEKKKNIAALVEAFYLLKNQVPDLPYKLYLIGDASFGFDDIKYSIFGYHLENDIMTTGWIRENDLPYIFSQARAFVFPSNYEGFGIPLLQAMATGTPIVASGVTAIPEIAGEAAELVDPANPLDIARGLKEVLTNETLRQDLIAKGLERVKNYSWEKCAKETLSLIKAL